MLSMNLETDRFDVLPWRKSRVPLYKGYLASQNTGYTSLCDLEENAENETAAIHS